MRKEIRGIDPCLLHLGTVGDQHVIDIGNEFFRVSHPGLFKVCYESVIFFQQACVCKDTGILAPIFQFGKGVIEFCLGVTDPGKMVNAVGNRSNFI